MRDSLTGKATAETRLDNNRVLRLKNGAELLKRVTNFDVFTRILRSLVVLGLLAGTILNLLVQHEVLPGFKTPAKDRVPCRSN